ncbi:MAG: formate dehydrogenase accessory protein FdhE [Variovorax sp.]
MSIERLAALERKSPQWQSWTAVLRILAQSISDRDWRNPVVEPKAFSKDRPLLDGQHVCVSAAALAGLVQRLIEATADEPQVAPNRLHAELLLPFLHESITGATDGIETDRFGTLINAACSPLLAACADQLAQQIPPLWPHGWCPVCGAWPVIAELIGLDRSRSLRCGRCGTGWNTSPLTCSFCGQADHAQLGALVASVAGAGEQAQRVDTCRTCNGYLKSIAVLTSGSFLDVMLADLESVALDLAARDEGFIRPDRTGHAIRVTLSLSSASR